MLVPVRCFSCNKVIEGSYEEFIERKDKGEERRKRIENREKTEEEREKKEKGEEKG